MAEIKESVDENKGYAKPYHTLKYHEKHSSANWNINVRELNWLVTYISIYTKQISIDP